MPSSGPNVVPMILLKASLDHLLNIEVCDVYQRNGTPGAWRIGCRPDQRAKSNPPYALHQIRTFAVIAVALDIAVFSSATGQFGGDDSKDKEITAAVNVYGEISEGGQASAEVIKKGLRQALEDKRTKAVVLRINSPGGSPVQAGEVYDEIKRQRELHKDTKIYAVISDLGASGAYYIASAADEIYANKSSLVGSIGVTAASFGYVDLMRTLGWSAVLTRLANIRPSLIRSNLKIKKRPHSGRTC